MKTTKELEKELENNTRAFILMMGYGKANLFKDLNKRFEKTLKELKQRRRAKYNAL